MEVVVGVKQEPGMRSQIAVFEIFNLELSPQMVSFCGTMATGGGTFKTDTVTISTTVSDVGVFIMVTVYVVFALTEAIGVAVVELLKPVAGDQE